MPPPLFRVPSMPSRLPDANEGARAFAVPSMPSLLRPADDALRSRISVVPSDTAEQGLDRWVADMTGPSYANEPHLSHGDTTPAGPEFYVPEMPSALPSITPEAAQAVASYQPPRPRLLGRPAAPQASTAPEVNSLGQTLAPDFIDGMTQSRAPMWVEPRETPYDRERRALEAARGIEQQRAEMMAGQAMDRADAEDAYLRRQNALEVQRREDEGRARQSMQRAADRLAATQMEPGRYWRNAGAFGVIGNALAVGLGALGESMGGGPNTALQTINEAIDRDLSAQERDITTATQDVENRRGLLREVQNEFVSRQGALEASRAILLRQAAAQAEAQAAQLGSQEIAANAARARDQLLTQAERAQAAAQAAEIEAALSMREQVARIRGLEARALRDERRAMGGGAGAPQIERVTTPQMQAFDAMVASGIDRTEAAARAGLPAGLVPQGNPITTEQRAPLDALDAALRQVEALVPAEGDIAGAGVWDGNVPNFMQSDAGLQLRVALEDMIDLYGRVRSGAAITEAEREAFRRNLIGGGTERELRVGLAQLRREISARLGRGGARESGGQAADRALASVGARQVVEE